MASIMERLSFGAGAEFAAMEVAIHLNRYLLAQPWCSGRSVLDVACGEGYGAYLMAERWGAAHVEAIDISEDAIRRAREHFASERITYRTGMAEEIDLLYEAASFDLIISLETIEHLHEPVRFLEALKRLRKPDGIVLISCPNDNWYYRSREERNPFHTRKYTFEEFRTMVEGALGPASAFLLGTPLAGFVNLPAVADPAPRWTLRDALLATSGVNPADLTPTDERLSWENCSYFVGAWGPAGWQPQPTLSAFAHSMDNSELAVRRQQLESLRDEVIQLRTDNFELQQTRAFYAEHSEAQKLRDYVRGLEIGKAAAESQVSEMRRLYAEIELRLSSVEAENRQLEWDLQTAERHQRHAELRSAAAQSELEYVREEGYRLKGHATWLENEKAELARTVAGFGEMERALRQTIADQTKLVDERDAYIRELETRVNELLAEQRLGTMARVRRRLGRMFRSAGGP